MRASIGAVILLGLVAVPVFAQKEYVTDRYSVEFEGGFLTRYDDSGLWNHGFDAGVTGFRAQSASTSLCVRFGISHWSYAEAEVLKKLVPAGSEIVFEQSSGQIEILSLTPVVRYQREQVLGSLGAFIEAGVGMAYVKTFALTDVGYSANPADTEVATFETDESDVRASVLVGAGFARAVSSSSWIELIPSYRAVFGDETAHVVAVSFGFRVRV